MSAAASVPGTASPDYDKHRPVLGLELCEQLAELGFGVGRTFVEGFLPGPVPPSRIINNS
ncbi:hypothetical protein ABT127_30600 [Streptomyces sp. NPDC001904]|uniref:hypothetical protein n=1 Tax=Streptomyces sp. NPDC001904 TaxID=3154531 RepID=UPI00331EED0C